MLANGARGRAASWAFLILGAFLALFLFWSFTQAPTRGKLTLLSRARGQHQAPPPVSPPVARYQVGEGEWITVTQQEVLQQKAVMDVPGGWPSTRKVALNVLLQNRILHEEARRRGLEFSRADAVAMARQQQALFNAGSLPGQEDMRAMITALQIEPYTFWTVFVPDWYQRVISVAQLRQSLTPQQLKSLDNALQRKLQVEITDASFFGQSNPPKTP